MQRNNLKGVWILLGALGQGNYAGCPGASCRSTLTARIEGNRLTCRDLVSAQTFRTAATCCSSLEAAAEAGRKSPAWSLG